MTIQSNRRDVIATAAAAAMVTAALAASVTPAARAMKSRRFRMAVMMTSFVDSYAPPAIR